MTNKNKQIQISQIARYLVAGKVAEFLPRIQKVLESHEWQIIQKFQLVIFVKLLQVKEYSRAIIDLQEYLSIEVKKLVIPLYELMRS